MLPFRFRSLKTFMNNRNQTCFHHIRRFSVFLQLSGRGCDNRFIRSFSPYLPPPHNPRVLRVFINCPICTVVVVSEDGEVVRWRGGRYKLAKFFGGLLLVATHTHGRTRATKSPSRVLG